MVLETWQYLWPITKFACALDGKDGSLCRKPIKVAENKDLGTAVYTWFMQVGSLGQPISGSLICEREGTAIEQTVRW